MRTTAAQREAILDFLLLAAAEEGSRPFPEPVVEALRQVVPSDTVAYRAWNRERGILDRAFAPAWLGERWAAWLQYPELRHDDPYPSELANDNAGPPSVSADDLMATPLVLTDAVSRRRFWQTGLYYELMRPFGVRDVMKLFLPHDDRDGSVFVFDTSGGFSDDDRAVLRRLVPALEQLERNARLRSRELRGRTATRRLSPRERTVLARAAEGETNAEIARGLFIGESTVRKHFQHIYEKLEVRNRAAAVASYFNGR
jgi:DNA-binding CsgD family transcriptional regulator